MQTNVQTRSPDTEPKIEGASLYNHYNEFHYVMTGPERADAWVRPLPRKACNAPVEES